MTKQQKHKVSNLGWKHRNHLPRVNILLHHTHNGLSRRRQTHATCCLVHIVLYTDVNSTCDELAECHWSNADHQKHCQLDLINDGRQFITSSVRTFVKRS